jgi:Tfp pilus assembly protein PilO
VTAKKKKKEMIVGGSLAALALVVLVGGYMLVISPKRSAAASLQREAAETQSKLTLALAQASHPSPGTTIDATELFRLSKAMPDRVDTADAILDLVRVGKATGVTVDGLSTADPTPATDGTYQLVPITATLGGRYIQIANFLDRVRHLVAVRDGQIGARGRLFGVDSISLAQQTDAKLTGLKATVVFETYVYSSGAAAAPPASTTPPADSSSDLSAAGAAG